jgi:hypothetical protein
VYGAALGDQTAPAVAWDGTNSLVVWQDRRGPTDADIFAARVSPAGTVLDVAGIPVSTAPGDATAPAVAWNGTHFLVVWEEVRTGLEYEIRGARVSPTGAVLDPAGFPIGAVEAHEVSVAGSSSGFFVVWTDTAPGTTHIRGARVTNAGAVLDPTGVPIAAATVGQSEPAVTSDGSNYLVTWSDFRSSTTVDVYAARVTAGGVVSDPGGIPVATTSSEERQPAVAWNGAHYLVAFQAIGAGPAYGIRAARVGTDGVVADPNGFAVSALATNQASVTVGAIGGTFFLAWEAFKTSNTTDLYGARVSAGAVLAPGRFPIATGSDSHWSPAVAANASAVLVAWHTETGPVNDIAAGRVTGTTPNDGNGFVVSKAAAAQGQPDVAFDGTNHLVVWTESRDHGVDLRATRVGPAGAPLDGGGIVVATGTVQQRPAVAFDGTNYLVVWLRSDSLRFTRVTTAGVVLDDGGIPIAGGLGLGSPDVAWDGANFVVVWDQLLAVRPFVDSDVFAARITSGGVVLDVPPIPLATGTDEQSGPAIASNGAGSFVVWTAREILSPVHVFAARLRRDGVVVEPGGARVSLGDVPQASAAVAADGAAYQVVWGEFREEQWDVYGARLGAKGGVAGKGARPISTGPGDQELPAVACNGDCLVTWRDERDDPLGELRGTRLRNGVPLDPAAFVVDASAPGFLGPAVARARDRAFLVAHSEFTGPPFNSIRAFVQTVAPK